MNKFYKHILTQFPTKHIKTAFAYGSGVFEQSNNPSKLSITQPMNKSSQTMIDFVFVVDNVLNFHNENLKMNSNHYSFLKYIGPYYLSRLQNDLPAACYYNTLIPIKLEGDNQTQLIKYGIIGEDALIKDLYDWDYLYMSGRLQKPVKFIKKINSNKNEGYEMFSTSYSLILFVNLISLSFESDLIEFDSVEVALQANLQNALHTALLLMPAKFTLTDLFICITSLSYQGDFRMIIGENKKKCENIVTPQMDRFTLLYNDLLMKECSENSLTWNMKTGELSQDLSSQVSIYRHFNMLPKNLIEKVIKTKFGTTHYYDMEEFLFKLSKTINYKDVISKSLASIVRRANNIQTIKGIFSAGIVKTVNYSIRKLKKMSF
jgi:mitochondrial translocator assembly and maintenance protein 41